MRLVPGESFASYADRLAFELAVPLVALLARAWCRTDQAL